MTLPVLTLAVGEAAYILRTTRGAMDETLGTPFVAVPARARASPSGRSSTATRCATPSVPIVTVIGIQFGVLLGGAIVIETLFGLPGRRPADRDRDQPAQLHGRAGRRARRRDALHPGQPRSPTCSYGWLDPRIDEGAERERRGDRGARSRRVVARPRGRRRRDPRGARAASRSSPRCSRRTTRTRSTRAASSPGPTLSHPFGSDALGRDVLSRVLFAYRVSLGVAVGSVLVAMAVGIPLGLLAGFYGGAVDSLIMRPVDLLLALPALLLALVADRDHRAGQRRRAVRDRRDLRADPRAGRPQLRARRSRRETYVAAARARGVSRAGCMVRHVLAQLARPGDRAGERAHGVRDPDRGGALVPRARRAAADAVARA